MKTLLSTIFAATMMLLPMSMSSTAQDTDYISAEHNLSAEDDLAIRQVIARLNHALDAADYDLYASFFAEDGVFESGFGDAIGPAQVAAALDQVRPFIINKRHVAGNFVISGEGDDAVVTTYLIVFEREAGLEYVGSAINVDTMRRIDGEWMVVRHASTLDPATERYIQEQMQQQ
ncbi:nuclear transport factor 2 family protein [Nereida sp. MMG025]|uniref:nuclear transport factor 2 family protein n=1 Tax=Nereida sp. MMG025 TaxID=2909981 RepID=UPI001F478C85|nr:nuclear transport factor 2 family protein [Nereida sp. MMG025]MCF6446040.1 nuclear transport factor 2 family protein [Nereida sp. MMG025]